MEGLTHIYYGDGSGKTTAAFGLAFRCAGRGERVVIAQFLKGMESGEMLAAGRCPEITTLRWDGPAKFTYQMDEGEKVSAGDACLASFEEAARLAAADGIRLLVLDEVIDAVGCGFLSLSRLCGFLDKEKPSGLEVVMTGHSLPEKLAARADYISRVTKEKHPYDKGVMARKGIEF